MDSQNIPTTQDINSPSETERLEDSLDYAFQLELLKQQNERHNRIKALKQARIRPLGKPTTSLGSAAPAKTPAYYNDIFLDGTIYDSECTEKLLESGTKIYEDLRDAVHLPVPDSKFGVCFCGFYSSDASKLSAHIAGKSKDESAIESLLEQLPATNMCENCQQIMRRAAHGDFTDTWYDGKFSVICYATGLPHDH